MKDEKEISSTSHDLLMNEGLVPPPVSNEKFVSVENWLRAVAEKNNPDTVGGHNEYVFKLFKFKDEYAVFCIHQKSSAGAEKLKAKALLPSFVLPPEQFKKLLNKEVSMKFAEIFQSFMATSAYRSSFFSKGKVVEVGFGDPASAVKL